MAKDELSKIWWLNKEEMSTDKMRVKIFKDQPEGKSNNKLNR